MGLGDVPGAGMEYLRAEHELKYRQALFDMLLKQYDAAKLDEAKDAAIIQVVEPAIEPERRSSLKPGVRILLFTLGGVLSGCLLALLWWRMETLRSDPRFTQQLRDLKFALLRPKDTL